MHSQPDLEVDIMHEIAFIIGDRFVYWTPIILALGIAAAVCMFLALYLGRTGKTTGAFVAVPLALGLSLVLGRLVYWLCAPDKVALLALGTEGFALSGIVLGCVFAACMVRLVGLSRSLPTMLDAMSLAGLLGLLVARLNHRFNSGGLGFSFEQLGGLPEELWPPIYVLQSQISGVMFGLLLVFYLILGRKRAGDTCLMAAFFHGAVQVVLDGCRYDALLLPGIPFVTLEQMCGLLMMLLTTVLFCIRMVKNRGWRWWYLALWIPFAAVISFAGVVAVWLRFSLSPDMEIRYVAVGALAVAAALMLGIYILSITGKRKWVENFSEV